MARRWVDQADLLMAAQKADFRAKKLAQLWCISMRQLQRDFRREFRRSPREWLEEERIIASQKLLNAGLPVKVVALEMGFKQVSHFCRRFKSFNGVTPTQFTSQLLELENPS